VNPNPDIAMSIHAQLTPEALEAIRRQKRNSTVSSFLIAVMALILVGIVLGISLIEIQFRKTDPFITYHAPAPEEPPVDKPVTTTRITRNKPAPSPAEAKAIAVNAIGPVAIPVPEFEVQTPSTQFGNADDFGAGWGIDDGPGDGFEGLNPVIRSRCSPEDRLARLHATGGTPECETAVEKGLEWLQATQNPDGSWSSGDVVGYTGLGLLCFLGRCETPASLKYGDTVTRAIIYLIDVGMKNDGRMAGNFAANSWVYEHAIATYALAEAYTFCNQLGIPIPHLRETVEKAGRIIIDHQNETGGWAYRYETRGGHVDSSVTAWQMQALKAMEYTGLPFEGLTRTANRGTAYLESLQHESGGFGYRTANSPAGNTGGYFTMTGGSTLALQLWGKGNSSAVRNGARYIEQHSKFEYDGPYSDLLGVYYEAQVMMHRGGAQWRAYNAMIRDELLRGQDSDGSWKPVNTQSDRPIRAVGARFTTHTHYRTCLAILSLEVYYRFLPGTGSTR
jgi:hypothetical protein